MNDINRINNYGGLRAIGQPQITDSQTPGSPKPTEEKQADQVEISQIALYMHQISQLPAVRAEKVDAVRQALADGSYDIEGKLPLALDRFLDDYVPK